MAYRKLRADFIFNGKEILPPESVLITTGDGTIVSVAPIHEAGDDIETYAGMLVPGFVNAHCHLELSHMRNLIPPGSGLISFLTRVIKERSFPPPVILEAMTNAEQEMFSSGIVAVGDICNTTDSILLKRKSLMHWVNFIEVIGFTKDKAADRFAYATRVLAEFQQAFSLSAKTTQEKELRMTGDRRFESALSPHAPYSVSQTLFGLINEASAGKVISIHNQESEAENELYETRTGQVFELYRSLNIDATFFEASGKSSLQTYLPWLQKASKIVLVHNTYTGEDDILFTASLTETMPAVFFCVCINANRYIEAKNPPLGLLRQWNARICLGTDSYASNWQLNILEEIKTIQQQFPDIPLREILQWATSNGAKALNMDDKLGSFDSGKQPGVVLIDIITNGKVGHNAVGRRIL